MIRFLRHIGPLFAFIIWTHSGFAQARIVFNNDAYVTIENQGRLVIDNPNDNAITNPGQGNLVSEDEFDMLRWNIGTNTGTYDIPFTDNTGEKMRFTMQVVTAGSGSGHFLFSSYDSTDWDNDRFRPSDVTHMLDYATGSVNNSDYVIDRFWIVDAEGYSTKPEPDMSFGYDAHELQTNGGNDGSLTNEGDLRAQRFNNSTNEWGDLLPVGSNPGPNPVQDVQVSTGDFYRSWTLVNQNEPLPVELLSFEANCDGNERSLTWETASESGNDHFLLERSPSGSDFEVMDTVEGAGTTPTGASYEVQDPDAGNGFYYRLIQVDRNGSKDTLSTLVSEDCGPSGDMQVAVEDNGGQRPTLLVTNPKRARDARMQLFDARGRLIQEEEVRLHQGMKRIPLKRGIERGSYYATIRTDESMYTKKVILQR